MTDVAGRVALVTGGARRLGRAFVEALADAGMDVAIHHGSSPGDAASLVDHLRTQRVRTRAWQSDLRDISAPAALIADVVAHFGRLDLLVNSAAVMEAGGIDDTTSEAWDRVMALNLRAPFLLAQATAPHLRASQGAIINIADLSGLEPWPNYVAHSVSKAGVVMLTKILAKALAPDVRVNAIAPGTVLLPDDYDDARRRFLAETTPLARLGLPGDAVEALMYLAAHADFVTGQVLVVDGGRVLRR